MLKVSIKTLNQGCEGGFIAIDNLQMIETFPSVFDVSTDSQNTNNERTTEQSTDGFKTSLEQDKDTTILDISTEARSTQNDEASYQSTDGFKTSLEQDKDTTILDPSTEDKQTSAVMRTTIVELTPQNQALVSENSFFTSTGLDFDLLDNSTDRSSDNAKIYQKEYEMIAYIMSGCGVFLILSGSFFIFWNYRVKRRRRVRDEALQQQRKAPRNHTRRVRKVGEQTV